MLTAVAALWPVLAWALLLLSGQTWPAGFSAAWHAHELLFGVVAAAAAGFLLTAIPHWTARAPYRRRSIYLLSLLWLAGRVAMFGSGHVPPHWVALVDGAFLPLLAAIAAHAIIRARAWRNLPVVAVLTLWAVANGMMHSGWLGLWAEGLRQGERLVLDLLLILMAIIGGRITPAFTRNWLRRKGDTDCQIDDPAWLRGLSLLALALLAVSGQWSAPATWMAWSAAIAAGLLVLRAGYWQGWRTRQEPLLWILHLGWMWLVASLVFRAGSVWAQWPESLAHHALGAGAMGTLIIAVMTRVALGHTGRVLQLPHGAQVLYWLIISAALLRLLAASGWFSGHIGGVMTVTLLLVLAVLAWVFSFTLYLWFYWPILSRPRVDGLPG